MNSADNMGQKMTYTGFFKKISIFLKPGKRNQKWGFAEFSLKLLYVFF